MSTLQITEIVSTNDTTDLVLKTGNTNGPQIVIAANGQSITLRANSVANSVFINSSSVSINGSVPVTGNLVVTGSVSITGNVTPTVITSNTTAWNPGTSNVFIIRVSANTANPAGNTGIYEAFISGLTAATNGQIIVISNIGSQKIWLRNEDSANESTAGNRFNMPNHVWLSGFQSIKMQYDGTLARWRPMNSALIAMDHKYSLTKGFFSGTFAPTTNTDKITYSSETASVVTPANLSQARQWLAAAGNADKGFFVGGGSSPVSPYSGVATTDRTIYSSETTAAVSGANLSQARWGVKGLGNADKGLFAGGATTSSLATADRTTYSSETTAAVSGANLSQARQHTGAAGNVDKGFFAGGATPALAATTDKTTYASETTAAVSGANLSQAREYPSAAGNADKGFFSGGQTPTAVTTTDRTTYASETTAAVSGANLTQARGYQAAAGNDNKGFFSGVAAPATLASDRITYSSETISAISGAKLSDSRSGIAAV